MTQQQHILVTARTPDEVRFLLKDYAIQKGGVLKKFEEGEVNEYPIGNMLYLYTLNGTTIIAPTYNRLSSTNARHKEVLLNAVALIIGASSSDHKKIDIREYEHVGVNKAGIWAIPKKGHDTYHFNMRGKKFTICGRPVSDIILVGEGNNLRDVRRYIRREMESGLSFTSVDVQRIKQRMCNYKLSVLIRFQNERVLNLGTGKVYCDKTSTQMPSRVQTLLEDRKEYTFNVSVNILKKGDPIERMLQQEVDGL